VCHVIDRLFQRYFSFYKLLKAVAWIVRVKDIWKRRCSEKCTDESRSSSSADVLRELSVDELRRAEESVMQYVQL